MLGIQKKKQSPIYWFLLLIIVVSGFLIRVIDIEQDALSGDEVSLGLAAKGVIKHGYPIIEDFHSEIKRPSTTSELVSYLIAPSLLILGERPLAIRMHSVITGTLSIVMLFILALKLFNVRTAFFAATIYTFSPQCITCAQWARYPSTLMLLAMLTIYFFWHYMVETDGPSQRKYIIATAVCYLACFFSWQGSGFFLLALFVANIVYKGKDFSWLKDRFLLSTGFILFVTMYFVLLRRSLITSPIMVLGMGTQNVSLKPLWSYPTFDLLYYVDNFLLTTSFWFVSVPAFFSLIWLNKDKAIAVLWTVLTVTILMMTFFLETRGFRYAYYLFPCIVILGSYVVSTVFDYFIKCANNLAPHVRSLAWMTKTGALIIVIIFLILPTSLILELESLYGKNMTSGNELSRYRLGSNTSVIKYFKEHYRPGDKIISFVPHQDYFYLGKVPDFFIESLLQFPVIISGDKERAVHRISWTELIYTLEDFKKIQAENRRIWFIGPSILGSLLLKDDDSLFRKSKMKQVAEDINFDLYLWEN
ncbi:ArnT family glycosyltransferase [candidate division CSSED10-310 bacterium]|uniref:ArnT family glycosyltransferase n=1 Tax=candidate division CSSED10-310 bacterium TaxID=2855610 RepID=A0ABV6YZ17_UNCC1